MHVLVITSGFPENEKDTDCIPPMQEYFRSLIKNHPEIKVTVISIHYPYKNFVYQWESIKVYSCGAARSSQPKRFLYWLRAVYLALKINRKSKIDIIHSFWLTESAMIAAFISLILQVKHINTMMGQDAKSGNKYLKILPLKKIMKVAVSENQSLYFSRSAGKEPEYVIPWGIEKFFVEKDERAIDLVGAGSLIPLKNFRLFIEIVKKLKTDFPSIKCLLIGDGVERGTLEELISKYDLRNNISLTGHIKREEVLRFMMKSKILLHTSGYEAYGYVIAEALASGCYVVSKNVGCARQGEKLFVADTEEELSSMICRILKTARNYEPKIIHPVTATVDSYVRLYEKYSAG